MHHITKDDMNPECRLCEVDLIDTITLEQQDNHCIRIQNLMKDKNSKFPDRDRYAVDKALLYHKNLDEGKEYQAVFVPKVFVPTILKEMYDRFGHIGIGKTYSLIKRYYFWLKIIKHIQRHVQSCSLCRREKLVADKYQCQTTEISHQPFAKVSIVLIVDPPESHKGNKNIPVMVDHLSGFLIAEAIPNKEATTVSDAIYKLILEHTCPKILLSDNGKEFTNDTPAYVCDTFNIEQHFTSPYMPQSDGKTENFNRFLKTSIRKLCQDDMGDWAQVLGQILMAYRCCPHTSTGESPFLLVYNMGPALPIHKLIKSVRPYRGDMTIARKLSKHK